MEITVFSQTLMRFPVKKLPEEAALPDRPLGWAGRARSSHTPLEGLIKPRWFSHRTLCFQQGDFQLARFSPVVWLLSLFRNRSMLIHQDKALELFPYPSSSSEKTVSAFLLLFQVPLLQTLPWSCSWKVKVAHMVLSWKLNFWSQRAARLRKRMLCQS